MHRATLRVVDGMHRLRAAALKGQRTVEVTFTEGSREELFLRSVEENIAHGLPLSLSDRKAAAERVLAACPQLSDRTVAARTGLSAKTVAAIRRGVATAAPRGQAAACSAAESAHANSRVGADGRWYPLDGAAGRWRAAEIVAARPDASLRQVARAAGVSVATAHDVRGRLRRGEPPVPGRAGAAPARPVAAARADGAGERLSILRELTGDPSLRHTDAGRGLLRWLHLKTVLDEDLRALAHSVPAHRADAVAELARHCARAWQHMADELTRQESNA
ncbi:ParB N-terminal domain-containing protein [Streptomyces sp. G45]|uniref:ParB N-terminal domain-containing protein n=1 Tax=Streptomyces sp. G45 TaxID=3406627 RepID=UPI003C18AB1A